MPASNKSNPPTPPPGVESGRETPKDFKTGSGPFGEKSEKERAKRERRKERKQQERAEREAVKETTGENRSGQESPAPIEHREVDISSPPPSAPPKSGKATPEVGGFNTGGALEDPILSPGPESGGAKTPTTRRPQRNPWTIFMRMPNPANEQDVRDFFLDSKSAVRSNNDREVFMSD